MTGPRPLRCVMAQLNLVVGDVDGNTSRIVAATVIARDQHGADVVLLPELAVSGYPPEDLLFHSGMRAQVANSIDRLKHEVKGITLIAGYPEYEGARIFNAAIVIRDGVVLANHRKACLPNYRARNGLGSGDWMNCAVLNTVAGPYDNAGLGSCVTLFPPFIYGK